MKIVKRLKRKLFPTYTRWQMFKVVELTETWNDEKASLFQLVEMRENKHSGKKHFKTTTQFCAPKGIFTTDGVYADILAIQSKFKSKHHHAF